MHKMLLLLSLSFATCLVHAHQIPNFQQVHNQIFRGGRPSPQDLKELKKMGVKTILNLENDKSAVAKERSVAQGLNFNFISIPTATFLSPKDDKVDEVLSILADQRNYPIFIHCTHGRDRTGLMMGLYRVEVDGWQPRAAYQEMVDLGFRQYLFSLRHYFNERTQFKMMTLEEEKFVNN